jgi:transcriptional regulator with XRE-family HTH domain
MPKKSPERLQEESLKRKRFAERLKSVKDIRKMSNTDILAKAKDLGIPMSKSRISQSLHGRFLPTEERAWLWSKIFNVDPLWLLGYGSDADMPLLISLEEENKQIQELIKLFAGMSYHERQLLLQIARQFRFPFESDTYSLEFKDPNIMYKRK